MAKTVRAGFSLGVFKRAVREVKGRGHLEREQGRSRKPGRGRGYAVDRLTFDNPERDYVMVERDLFDGTLTPTEITAILYLRARGDRYAAPWQLVRRLGATRPTISTILRGRKKVGKREAQIGLVERGIVKNYGTPATPLWGLVTLKNPTLKTTALKRTTLKRTTHTRKTYPSRHISPEQVIRDQNVGASLGLEMKDKGRTDCEVGTRAPTPQAMPQTGSGVGLTTSGGGKRERLAFSAGALAKIDLLPVDLEALIDRFLEYAGKSAAKGRPIADPDAYLLEMARDETEKVHGIEVDVHAISSRNEWARGAALAGAMRPPPPLPSERAVARIDARLVKEGLTPKAVKAKWSKGWADGTTRLDYSAFADAERQRARFSRGAT